MLYCPKCGVGLEDTWRDVQKLHAEIAHLKQDLREARVWIAALVKLQGGTVKVPSSLLCSLMNGFEIRRYHDDSQQCEVLEVSSEEERKGANNGLPSY